VLRSPGYVDFLATFVGGRPAGTCDAEYGADQAASDDATGNFNAFWAERDYRPDARHVHASVFVVHGINDQNVTTNQFGTWWNELAALGVPRKIWLHQGSHVDPFDMRRADWVDELHQWFDFWLQGLQNGVMASRRPRSSGRPGSGSTSPSGRLRARVRSASASVTVTARPGRSAAITTEAARSPTIRRSPRRRRSPTRTPRRAAGSRS